ncbi:PHP domain-containing protein [bacterium]|nr:PHP domain-containing protein [bacterium]
MMNIKELFLNFRDEDFFNSVNLHIHSNFSDGVSDFDKLIERAHELNLRYISITDHNTIEGYNHSKYKDDPILIKGVEFDCFYKMSPLHILGYGIDINNKELLRLCSSEKNDLKRLLKSRHPSSVINAIHSAGGIAILAHPCCCFVLNLDKYVKSLKKLGLDGIETHYPYNRFRSVVKFSSRELPVKIAQKYDLIKSGGTDEHKTL